MLIDSTSATSSDNVCLDSTSATSSDNVCVDSTSAPWRRSYQRVRLFVVANLARQSYSNVCFVHWEKPFGNVCRQKFLPTLSALLTFKNKRGWRPSSNSLQPAKDCFISPRRRSFDLQRLEFQTLRLLKWGYATALHGHDRLCRH